MMTSLQRLSFYNNSWRKFSLKKLIIVLFFVVLISFTNYAYGITVVIPVGILPLEVAIDPTNDRAYVAHGDGTVHVIDTNTDSVIDIIFAGPGALTGIAFNPATNKIYVANTGLNEVVVIDGSTNNVIDRIPLVSPLDGFTPVGLFPVDVEVNTNLSTLYVSNLFSLTVVVIDISPDFPVDVNPLSAENQIIDVITGFDSPWRFTFDPNTNLMYMASFFKNEVSVLDGFQNALLGGNPVVSQITVDVLNAGDSLEFNPTNKKIYVTIPGSDTVSVIDANPFSGTFNTVINTIPVGAGPAGVGVDAANNRIYVSNKFEGTLSVIDGSSDTVVKTIPTDTSTLTPRPGGLEVHSGTGKVYVGNAGIFGFGTVSVIDFDANNPPVARAGPDQVVGEGDLVTLNGADSSDPDGGGLSFIWFQTSGPTVTLSSSTSTSFIAPQVNADTLLTFFLTVLDPTPLSSIPDVVNVVVEDDTSFLLKPVPSGDGLVGTKIVGDVFAGSTYTFNIDGPLPSAELRQLVIPSGVTESGVVFSFTEFPQVPSGIVEPDFETALFINLKFKGVDFSQPANFESGILPKIQFLVDSGLASAQSFADGCPVVQIELLNEVSGQWEQIGDPQQANTNKIYVSNLGLGITPGKLSVIDGSTNDIIDTITVGLGTSQVAFDQNTNRIYVANQGSATVSVIDGSTNSVIAEIPVGITSRSSPFKPVVNPNTSLIYVTNQGDVTVSVIDGVPGSPTENTVIAEIPVEITPSGIDIDTTLNKIYVANGFSSTVSVIDGDPSSPTFNTNISPIPPIRTNLPTGIEIDSDNHIAYVDNFGERSVSLIDTVSDTVIGIIQVGIHPAGLDFNPATNRLYVANQGSGTVSIIDTEINAVIATVATGITPFEVAANPNTNRAYVANVGSGTVSVIDGMPGSPTENQVIDTITGFSNNFGVALNPDVPNPVRDPSSDVVGQCAYIAEPPHFSKFAIGGVALALLGGGGGGGSGGSSPITSLDQLITSTVIDLPSEVEQMVFNHDSSTPISPMALGYFEDFDYPLIINDKGFILTGFETTLETQTLQTNIPVTMIFTVYEAEKIQHFSLYTNLRGANSAIHQSDTQILYNDGGEIHIVDPNGFFENIAFTLNEIDDLKKQIVLEITFANPMDTSHIITRIWDPNLFSRDTHILDAFKVVSDIAEDSPIPTYEEPVIEELPPSIPKWIKNNAGWWSEQQISDSDFVSGIQYLIKNGFINVPGVEVGTDSASTEIPDWIKNNAGWWADSLITDVDFIEAMQWLVANGVIQI